MNNRFLHTNPFLKLVSVSPDATPNRVLLTCLAIVCVAFGVRLLQWQNDFLTLDKNMTRITARYKEEAQFLQAGDLTSFLKGSQSQPDEMILTHPPGYPILMAVVYKISGNSDAALRLFQITCEALAAVLVFLIAARLIPRSAAVVAALLVAVAPQLTYRSLLLLPDSLTALPILAAILLVLKTIEHPSVRNMILAGALIGISCWLRADALLLPVFLSASLVLLLPRGQRRRHVLALIGGTAIVVAPITLRNALVFRDFVPVGLGTGQALSAGIGEYDVEQRFGLSPTDYGTSTQEAQQAGRPDYAAELYRPEGIERDRQRVARAWAVIRSNPGWFVGVMLRRTLTMLTYEPVPIVSAQPTVLHPLEVAKDKPLVWSPSPQGLLSESQTTGSVRTSVSPEGEATLRLESSNSFQLVTKPIAVRPNFDYVLTVPVRIHQGRASITVRRLARPQILASASLPDSLERLPFTNEFAPVVQIPFVSPNENEVQLMLASVESSTPVSLDIGSVQLNELGSASYLWTRYPRMLVKSVQKLFVTRNILTLTILGLILLAFHRRKVALAVILTVPLYYLFSHAPLHFEHRYILPAHFFWFILVGLAIYWMALMCMRLVTSTFQFFGSRHD